MAKIALYVQEQGGRKYVPARVGVLASVPLREVGVAVTAENGVFTVLLPEINGGIIKVVFSEEESAALAKSLRSFL